MVNRSTLAHTGRVEDKCMHGVPPITLIKSTRSCRQSVQASKYSHNCFKYGHAHNIRNKQYIVAAWSTVYTTHCHKLWTPSYSLCNNNSLQLMMWYCRFNKVCLSINRVLYTFSSQLVNITIIVHQHPWGVILDSCFAFTTTSSLCNVLISCFNTWSH